MMKRTFKVAFALIAALSALFMLQAVFSAEGPVLEKLFEIPTQSTAGWTAGQNTSVSSETIKVADSHAVSFTSSSEFIEAEFGFTSDESIFSSYRRDLVLKIRLFVSDVSALKGEKGRISFLCSDGSGADWSVGDLSLKNGWNDITLNFRTARTFQQEKTEPEITEEEEQQTDEQSQEKTDEAETDEQPEEIPVKTDEEIFAELSVFSFRFERNPAKDIKIAFSEISVNAPEKEEKPEVPAPITDDINAVAVTVSLIIAAAITVCVMVFSARYAKKEIKRRKREAKKRRAEQINNEEKPE